MSLASTAFPWINDDPNKNQKKVPVMNRKTVKTRPANDPASSDDAHEYTIYNLGETQKITDDRTNKVTEIINQMSSVSIDNDGSGLADFTPPPNPSLQQKKPQDSNLSTPLEMPSTQPPFAPSSQFPSGQISPSLDRPTFSNQQVNPYSTQTPLGTQRELGNYNQIYSAPATSVPYMYSSRNTPQYTSLGLGAGDGKMLEKINYMIHMLENMEGEKTANITEEFVLYSFTGIFIIFVLDSFLKTGKYVR